MGFFKSTPAYKNTREAIEQAFGKEAHGDGVTMIFVVEGIGVFRYRIEGVWEFHRKEYLLKFSSRHKMLKEITKKLTEYTASKALSKVPRASCETCHRGYDPNCRDCNRY